ncbi:signal peptidase I [Williamsia herbipolensis]|uniref:signal peptidase I n=1 Tax=Williamsia herbipolensis TaxID=1603258 RepID=UPI00069751C4|nr:signal peptidase I [Williamsia herbipolensis]
MTPRARRYLTEIALTVGAIAGVLCVLAAVAGVAFGLSPLVFRTDSMAPTIGVGDVAIARSVSASSVAVGDIVSVTRPDGERVTHRVATIDARVGNSTTLTLRGDANTVADAAPYTVTSVDRVVFDIPKLGYVMGVFASPYAWVLATMATLGLLWIAFGPDRRTPVAPVSGRHARHAAPERTSLRRSTIAMQAVAVVLVVAAAVTGYARTSGTLAALTDSATAAGAVSAIRPDAPTSMSCVNQSGAARLSWPNPAASQGYDYQLVFTPTLLGGSASTAIVTASTTDPAGLLVTRSYVNGLLGLGVLGTYSVELRSKVGNFVSTGRVTITVNLVVLAVSCGSATGTPSQNTAAARLAAPATTSSSAPSTAPTTSTPTSPSAESTAPDAASSSSSSTAAPSSSSAPATSAPTSSTPTPTSTTPAAPGITSPNGASIASVTDGVVVIRDTASGAEQYRGDLSAASVSWVDDTTLRVTARDGTVTTVKRAAGVWSTTAAAPTTAPVG